MHPGEVWNGTSVGAKASRAALTPISWAYACGWQTYLWWYRMGFKRPAEPHRPVLCVGNLMVGGGGKSPLVMHLVEIIRGMGREVVVSASGYGSPRSEAATVAPEGLLDPTTWGDEPSMMRWLYPDLPLIVGRRRVLAAQLCQERFPRAVLVMDDGFQHLPLRKHVSLIVDPLNPPNARCLPAGPYREPRKNRARADLVLPGTFRVAPAPLVFCRPDGTPVSASKVNVLCALGQPEAFLANLREMAVDVQLARTLPDHDRLLAGNLFKGLASGTPLVVTAKDWVKLRNRNDLADREILIARQSVRVEPHDEFVSWLSERLDG